MLSEKNEPESEQAVKKLTETYRQAMQDLEPLARESASDEQHQEYFMRRQAIREHHEDALAKLEKAYHQLLIEVFAKRATQVRDRHF